VTSLKERLEAKQRRTIRHPVLVGDATAAEAEVATFRAVLDTHLQMLAGRRAEGVDPDDAEMEQTGKLRAQLAEAQKRLAGCVEMVELRALDPAEWDALCDDLPEDPDGGYDISVMRSLLMAASCTDPELQDATWWDAQFARPEWSKGDLLAVNSALLQLNLNTPGPGSGKG
jgi:hypothetical protein